MEARILDVCCGSRMFWFGKINQNVIYHDNRREVHLLKDSSSKNGFRELIVNPDVLGDFTGLQFADNTFALVVFDPPHLIGNGRSSWLAKKNMESLKPAGAMICAKAFLSVSEYYGHRER